MTEFPSIKDKIFMTVLCFNQAAKSTFGGFVGHWTSHSHGLTTADSGELFILS